jgi:putative transposase
MRESANAIDGVLADGCALICDRNRKWSRAVLEFLEREGVRIIRTPFRAPNCNAYAERFVRSIREECLARADNQGPVRRRQRIGSMLNYYCAA